MHPSSEKRFWTSGYVCDSVDRTNYLILSSKVTLHASWPSATKSPINLHTVYTVIFPDKEKAGAGEKQLCVIHLQMKPINKILNAVNLKREWWCLVWCRQISDIGLSERNDDPTSVISSNCSHGPHGSWGLQTFFIPMRNYRKPLLSWKKID